MNQRDIIWPRSHRVCGNDLHPPRLARRVEPGDWLDLYLREDLGDAGDVTSDSLFSPGDLGEARVVARERGFVVGLPWAVEVFARLGCTAKALVQDAVWVDAGSVLLDVKGPVRGILAAERLVLNLLGRMGGIATRTRVVVEELARDCVATRVAATRKTTPGFRFFEKEAVRLAGGDPHRAGLWDAAMVKDNHREAAGGVGLAVSAIRLRHADVEVTVEVESLEDALEAAAAGAQWLLIDNQDPDTGRSWAEAVWKQHPGVKVEASGGIRPERVASYGWADRVSLGALTQDVGSLDLSLEWGASS